MYSNTPNQSPKKDKKKEAIPDPRQNWGRSLLWLIVLVGISFWAWNLLFAESQNEVSSLNYSEFRQAVLEGDVAEVTIEGNEIQGRYTDSALEGENAREQANFITYFPSIGDESLLSILEQQDVSITTVPQPDFSLLAIVLNFLPFILIFVIGFIILRRIRQQGSGEGIFSMGKSQARLYDKEEKDRITFDDVAGLEGAKVELGEIVSYLKDPGRVNSLGGTPPTGILLVGPPGTGKTLLARAVAGEADVPFFSLTGSDFMEMFVGVGAKRVRDLFDQARDVEPCIIFIDEIDSIGRRRGAGLGGGHDEREQTLNQLLSELDGFEPSDSIVVMAATNRPDILDPALLRAGRFDRRVTVDLPTQQTRRKILNIHSRGKPLGADVDLDELARGTPGFSGADLENILNEAALIAARSYKTVIEGEDIEDARDKILMGLKREGLALSENEYRLIAYHEAGHALVAAILPNADPIHKVTIVPRGRAMGVTQQLPEQEKFIYTREYMLDRMAVMMGGRAAENIVFDTSTSGAENDFQQATNLARKMVTRWGMSEKIRHMSLGGESRQVFLGEQIGQQREYSETTAREIDQEIQRVLDEAYHQAVDVLNTYRQELDAIADALLEHEEIKGNTVLELLSLEPSPA